MLLDLMKTGTFAVLHFGVGFTVTYLLTGSVAIATGVALTSLASILSYSIFSERAWTVFRRRLGAAAIRPSGGGYRPAAC